MVFDTGLGNYDFEVFKDLSLGESVGQIFILTAVIINCIVLLNFIIAILADTYSKLMVQKLGIYYDGIIARIPVYKYDSLYGGLIVGPPPSNVLAIFMIPFYIFVKDKKRLRHANENFTRVQFLPLAFIITGVFMIVNIALIPFAYLAAIFKKLNLMRLATKKTQSPLSSKTASVQNPLVDLASFVLLGMPMLLLASLLDSGRFLVDLYREDIKELGLGD